MWRFCTRNHPAQLVLMEAIQPMTGITHHEPLQANLSKTCKEIEPVIFAAVECLDDLASQLHLMFLATPNQRQEV